MKPIIEVTNISKKYNINHQKGGYVALRDIFANTLKHPLRFLKSKTKEVFGIDTKEIFWALKDVNFEVQRGEVIGIIGKNGAGKSTLLKILSQITPPTTGEIKIRGRVGSLLEVGTGFHPELTGRENIFLNGAILGMKKTEIAEKFDAIVAFAGIEKFLDTPVKYYSSGMYVRLAFSVAAHMEPDILIVDEVLAVGDAEFQKKCLGKMEEITETDGRTILFVSHTMAVVERLCKRCILLEHGSVKAIGPTRDIIDLYTKEKSISSSVSLLANRTPSQAKIFRDIKITTTTGDPLIKSEDHLRITLPYDTMRNEPVEDGRIVITITNEATQQVVLMLDSYVSAQTWQGSLPAQGTIVCDTDALNITEGEYGVDLDFIHNGTSIDYIHRAAHFDVITDIEKYAYKNNPDKNTCHRLIKHSFHI